MPEHLFCKTCNNCLNREGDYHKTIGVCRICLALYAAVDEAISDYADEKARRMKLEKFAEVLR